MKNNNFTFLFVLMLIILFTCDFFSSKYRSSIFFDSENLPFEFSIEYVKQDFVFWSNNIAIAYPGYYFFSGSKIKKPVGVEESFLLRRNLAFCVLDNKLYILAEDNNSDVKIIVVNNINIDGFIEDYQIYDNDKSKNSVNKFNWIELKKDIFTIFLIKWKFFFSIIIFVLGVIFYKQQCCPAAARILSCGKVKKAILK